MHVPEEVQVLCGSTFINYLILAQENIFKDVNRDD